MNFPSQEIINPREMLRKNYEHIILWMLFNNDVCEWAVFCNEPLNISEATLSRYLGSLHKNGLINKVSRGHYKITLKGKNRYNELSKYKRDYHDLNYPPDIILKSGRNYDHWILWMLYNNQHCKRSYFTKEPLSINHNALTRDLNYLLEKGFIQKTDHLYKITQSGKIEYSKILRNYDLDRQTILEEESKRVDDITTKTAQFFDEFNINDEEVKFRFLNKVLKLDYSKVSMILTEEIDFHKILLFIVINHPDFYPNFISLEKFSKLYQIKKKVLDFWIDEIISGKIYDIKIHQLKVPPNKYYFFESNEKLEKILRAITENKIKRNKFLQKFGLSESTESLLDNILNEICKSLFQKDLKEPLREFLPEYIKYLAYKIETKRKLKDTADKLEGIIWKDLATIFHSQSSESLEQQYEEEIKEIERSIALKPKKYELYNSKIEILIYFNQYSEVLKTLDKMLQLFPEKEIELLMKKASILKIKKDIMSGFEIIEDLIKKYPDNNELQNYKAYWLRYLGKKEEAIEIVQELIKKEPKNATYHDTYGEILLYFEDYEEATKKFLKAIVLDMDNWFIYQTYVKLGTCYLALKNYDLAQKNLETGRNLIQEKVKDLETKQNWLAIADLFLAEVMDLKNEL
ncbi:MAG: tetratricopeptide repeat protein [Promethearchaeota archaeon]